MRSLSAAVVVLCSLLAVGASAAFATGGGGSIASAPGVSPGGQQSGSTATFTDTCGNGYEFWTLQLKQGDLVKITWGTPPAVDTLALFPPGTSDSDHTGCLYQSGWANWAKSPVLTDSNATAGITHLAQTTVTTTGSYPLVFLDTTGAQNAGAYAFTAVVLHGASVFLPQVSSVPERGKLTAAVLAPDSSPISDSSLKLTLNGFWSIVRGAPPSAHKLATATPSNGSATFSYRIPQPLWGKKIQLSVTGGGSTYQAVASEKETVKVLLAPVIVSPAELKTESKILRQPIYWAGPRKGFHYEFRRTANGYVYVRYLPRGVAAGAPGSKFLVVATYPLSGAYGALKKFAKGKAVAGPHGSIFFALPGNRESVYVAFPGVDYEVEVYDPSPKVARAIVMSGAVSPVG